MDGQSSDLEDPFLDSSLLSLFPRTFNQCDLHPDHNSLSSGSLEAVRPMLDSMALKNPDKLMEQAKNVLERLKVDNLENTRGEDAWGDFGGVIHENLQGQVENVENARDEDTGGDLRGVSHQNLQGRRPALGRKRARFSLKSKSSQSIECLKPDVDIDKFPDPEEFFSALEKHENAKNELRRQNGRALMDLDQNVPHMAERQRRPGILRKSATYKHRFSMAPSGDFLSSQEALAPDLCSPTPSSHCLQTENTDKIPVPSTRELPGPMVAGRDGPDDNSDEVQSGIDKDDESDDIIGMLKERFKPIQINKSCLSDLDSVLQSEFKILGESLQDSQDKMSDLHGIVSAIGKETTLGCNNTERSSGHPSTSLTPPKSPYSSISLLKARLYQSRKEKDPFSALDIDLSPLGKAASCKDTHDLSVRDLENFVKDSKNMPNISSVTTMHIDSGHATGGNDTMETNPNESKGNIASKDTQNLAAAKFTSSEKSISTVLSDFIDHMELDHDIVEHGERDITPKSRLHEKESDTNHTMETVEDGLKTLGAFSDGVSHIELDHAIRRGQSPKSAAHEKESNVVHSKAIHDLDAENLAPSKEAMKDNSIISGITWDTTPHVEIDQNTMVNGTMGRVLEHNPSEVFDAAAIASDQHIEPDGGVQVEEEDIQGPNMENSSPNKEQSTASTVEDLEKDRSSSDHRKLPTEGAIGDLDQDRPSSSQTQPLKKTRKASSKTTEDKSRKASEPSHEQPPAERRLAKAARKQTRESKECSQRKSLAVCGTRWETGMRRSTRIRTRPLEFWKGERQLYGRIYDSLITVVGTKYFSPTKEAGQATLKVKSYVSDEYMEIVERAALH